MTDALDDILASHRAGRAVGVTSVCSASPLVIQAACEQAVEDGTAVLIEATSNQVDQFGGYTGMLPADFRDLVLDIADGAGLPRDRVILGGDHLGPNVWRALPAEQAMAHADDLVRAYVEAGYTKIHLDCSMACADDRLPLTDEVEFDVSAVAPKPTPAAPTADVVEDDGAPTEPGPPAKAAAEPRESMTASEMA